MLKKIPKNKLIASLIIAILIVYGGFYSNRFEHDFLMKFGFYREKFCSEAELIKDYLKKGKDLNISFRLKGDNKTLLDCLIGQNDEEIIDLLSSQKFKINNIDNYNKALILYYIERNNIKELKRLISYNLVDLNIKYKKELKEETKNITDRTNYITYYFCENSSLLNEAIIRNNLEIVKILTDNGANINEKCFVTNVIEEDTESTSIYNIDSILTPLSKAIRLNNLEIVKYLLENNAELEQTIMPQTLAISIVRDEYELLKLLLEYGLNPEQYNKFPFKATHTQKSNNLLDTNRIKRTSKVNKYNSLLDFAEKRGSKRILNLFRQNRKDT